MAKHYLCVECKKDFPMKEVQVDHKKPVVNPKQGFAGWDTLIQRLYCEAKGLQVLCKVCHAVKTKQERALRK